MNGIINEQRRERSAVCCLANQKTRTPGIAQGASLSVSKKWLRPLFREKERDSASAEAGIFHDQPRLMAVKNVRNGFGRYRNRPARAAKPLDTITVRGPAGPPTPPKKAFLTRCSSLPEGAFWSHSLLQYGTCSRNADRQQHRPINTRICPQKPRGAPTAPRRRTGERRSDQQRKSPASPRPLNRTSKNGQ